MENDVPGSSQKAFQLIVGTIKSDVTDDIENVWNSGSVYLATIPAVYAGPELKPFTRYFWKVRIQDEKNEWSEWSPVAFFETGMMKQENWQGQWISDTYDYNIKEAPYFRQSFKVNKPIESARAYIVVAGLYELSINGNRIGDHILDPAFTRFDRRNLYVTYDVTKNLQRGENVIGVLLGNGWYNHQTVVVWYFDKAPWRARPKFCMDVKIKYIDGTEETISTDKDWKTFLSPVIFNSIYTAEHYDSRLEIPGWDRPGFDQSEWKKVLITGMPSHNITAQVMHPIKHVRELKAKEIVKFDDGSCIYDFGKNIAGVIRLETKGAEGTKIRLKHAERLDDRGRADVSNVDVKYKPKDDSDPFQTDIFILSGKKEPEVFVPRFNYKGFQYVEVSSDRPIELTEESLTAYFMHSDVPRAGYIKSSDMILNKVWEAANVSYLSNLLGYPTDCPQREKNGWTADAHIASEMGLYNFDGITIYEKWMADHRDEQQSNGVLPAIIPTSGWGYHWANGPDWTSTIAIIPWNIYLFYGDSHLLEECYENIKRYVDYIDKNYPSGLTNWGLGDWSRVRSKPPKEYLSSAYYYYDAVILAKAAEIFGKKKDHGKYTALAEKIKKAINDKYLDRETGIYGSGFQTELSVALHFELVPDELVPKVAENLAKKVISDKRHLEVGLLGSKALLNALSQNGYADLAYEVASQTTFPGWATWIANGATTFYEKWHPNPKKASLNHIMFGEISAWYYKALGGIFPNEHQPGFKNIILKPYFVSGLDQFEASHTGPYGEIISSWKKQGKKVLYNVTVPPNSEATLYLPSGKIHENHKHVEVHKHVKIIKQNKEKTTLRLKSGKYNFVIS